MNIDYVVTSEN